MNVCIKSLALSAVALAAFGCARATETGTATAPRNQLVLFDGSRLDGWEQVGPGRFVLQPDGSIVSEGGMGLFYYAGQPFRDFVLELEYRTESPGANSGIFVRFPERPMDPWDAVRGGYEIQIDDLPDPLHMTGSIYSFKAPYRLTSRPAGEWNRYRIEVTGQRYQVYLNGEKVNDFIGNRGREGYIGLQNHDVDSPVHFRDIRVTPLRVSNPPERIGDLFAVREQREPIRVLVMTATHGFRHGPAIEATREVLGDVARTTEFEFEFTEDVEALTTENLANFDVLFFANSTLRTPEEAVAQVDDGADSFTFTLNTPQGEMSGHLVLDGTPDDPSGTIQVGTFPPVTLAELRRDAGQVSFAFDGGEFGRIRGTARLQGDALQGALTVGDGELPLRGRRAGAASERVTEAQQQAILEFARGGRGVAVSHAGLDAFYGWDEYRELVGGGLFESHPWTRAVRINVEQPTNPAVRHLGNNFWLRDEIYVLDRNPRWNSQVLLSLDMPSVGVAPGSADASRDDHPLSWIRPYGEGRVFVTALGHFADVWHDPAFVEHLLQGLRIAAGRVPADFGGQRVKETLAEDVWAVNITTDQRDNVWIVELTGRVHLYDAATGETRVVGEVPTVDPAQIEHGLYDVEIDPNFYDGEPYVYAYYAERETFINTLSRFTFRDGRIDLSTEHVLLRVPTEPTCCHQAGDLEWGPDGTLFISTGDTGQSSVRPTEGTSQERVDDFVERNELSDYHWSRLADSERTSQNLQDLRGKILRINKDGSIPRDNPFYGQPGVRWEIYAYGLRNPYRFKYDAPTNRLYIGVVGPDAQFDYDEYVVSTRGGENFGWPRTMGTLFYNEWTRADIPDYAPVMWEYTYETGARSAHFGPVYRSEGERAFPGMDGKIFLYDWSRRWIKYADIVNGTFSSDTVNTVRTDGRVERMNALRLANIRTFDVLEQTSPLGMELGRDGCLYVAEFAGFWEPGPQSNLSRYCWDRAPAAAESPAPTAIRRGADAARPSGVH